MLFNKQINLQTNAIKLIAVAVVLLLTMLLANSAYAQITFGRVQTNSTMGQPLQAYIEVYASPQDAASIRGRTYRSLPGGGIESTITTRIVPGQNGVVVQLGSLVPINEPYLDVVVELINASGASAAQRFSLLINPSANSAYAIPYNAYTNKLPRTSTRRATSSRVEPKASENTVEQLDVKIAAAKSQLADLENKVQEMLAKKPVEDNTKQPKVSVSTPTTAPETTPVIPPVVTPEPVSPPVIVQPLPPTAVVQPAPPTVVTPPPVVQPPVVTPPPPVVQPPVATPPAVANKPKPTPPVIAKPVSPPVEEGLFGFSWLPNPMSILKDFNIDKFFSTEVLIGIGGLLAIIIGLVILGVLRKRKSKIKLMYKSSDDTDDYAQWGGAADFSKLEPNVKADGEINLTKDAGIEEEASSEEPKKKKSFFSKLKGFAKRKKKEVEEDIDENVDFATLVAAENKKATEMAKPATKSETKIQRIEDEEIKRLSTEKDMSKDEDFLKDLESLTKAGSPQAIDSTILVKSPSQAPKNNFETRFTPSSAGITANESIPFSDEITRITPNVEENPTSDAMFEMSTSSSLSSDQSAKTNGDIKDKNQNIELQDDATEISLDDLDFSSEKTMIMPQIRDLAKESEGISADNNESAKANDSDFNFNLDFKPSTQKPVVVEEKTSSIQPVSVEKATKGKTKIEKFDESYKPKANTAQLVTPDVIPENLEITNIATITPVTAKTQLAHTQIPTAESESAFAGLELPSLDLSDFDNIINSTVNKPPQSKIVENQTKATVTNITTNTEDNQNDKAMIDLEALDLSSIKLN